MKIVLINPYISKRKSYGDFSFASPRLVTLGLCSIASFIRKKRNDVKVQVLDLNMIEKSSIDNFIRRFKPEIVGITSTTVAYKSAIKLLDKIKNAILK